MKVLHRKYRAYAGPVIKGTVDFDIEPGRVDMHVDRAFWLTTKVETGAKFGAIMMADGTAVTAGLDQHIAVYPKELAREDHNARDDQGGFWKLLRRIETVDGDAAFNTLVDFLWIRMADHGWYLAQDGVLRYIDALNVKVGNRNVDAEGGDPVFGADIRNQITAPGGVVPSSGSSWIRARDWATAFHKLFAHPATHKAQVEFGREHLVHRTKRARPWKDADGTKRYRTVNQLAYTGEITQMVASDDPEEHGHSSVMKMEYDLAMCMYQAHSVNAPAIANRALHKVAKTLQPGTTPFSRYLIKELGNSTYGRWDDDIKYGRYQRTRSAARASTLWPRRLFDGKKAIMPKDLAG